MSLHSMLTHGHAVSFHDEIWRAAFDLSRLVERAYPLPAQRFD